MERRSLLALLATTALTGCTGSGPPGSDGGGGATTTDSPDTDDGSLTITDSVLTDTGECSNPETATVTFGSSAVELTGCITGPNGCSTAILGAATVDGDELRIVVDTDDTPDGDVSCTQALVQRGYDARISLDGGVPGTVVVTHASARGREEVTRAERP